MCYTLMKVGLSMSTKGFSIIFHSSSKQYSFHFSSKMVKFQAIQDYSSHVYEFLINKTILAQYIALIGAGLE
jgi:hypothetical protein